MSASSANSFDIRTEELFTVVYYVVNDFTADPVTIESAQFMFFDAKNQRVLTYAIPVETELDVPGKYGEEPIEKLLGLELSLQNGNFELGIDYTNKAFSNLFGFSTDRYIVVDNTLAEELNAFFTDGGLLISSNIDFLNKLNTSLKTDMTLNEVYYIYKYINSLPADRLVHSTLTESYLTTRDTLDEELRELTLDSAMSLETKSIAVLNGTQTTGVATFGARVVKNMGGRVIAEANASKTYDNSVLIVDDTSSETTKALQRFFAIDQVLQKEQAYSFNENEIDRADVILILGLDIADSM